METFCRLGLCETRVGAMTPMNVATVHAVGRMIDDQARVGSAERSKLVLLILGVPGILAAVLASAAEGRRT